MAHHKSHHQLQAAVAHHRAGRLREASALYAQLRRADPRHFDACHLGGTAALQLGRPSEAIALLKQALVVDPRSAVCGMRLGLALLAAGQISESVAQLRRITVQHPQFHEAWDNLGMALKSAGNVAAALSAHQRSVEILPKYAAGWYNLGHTHALLGRSDTALECHDRALAIDPGHANAHFGRGQSLQQLHRVEDAIAAYDRQLLRNPDHHDARSSRLFALNYLPSFARETIFAEHVEFGRRVGAGAGHEQAFPVNVSAATPSTRGERLRVAFLSPDLRTHAVASFLEPLLCHLDPGRFEIALYHDHYVIDAVSERLRSRATIWRHIVGVPDDEVARQILEDAPDILIDLAGHTGLNRMTLLARRMAAVQITFLGYPNTTGLSTIDYKITDSFADPSPESDAYHTERLVRLDGCAWTYQPPPDSPGPSPLPCATRAGITFGSFNNFSKISDFTIALWSRILNAVPGSRLVLKSHTKTHAAFLERLTRNGLDASRVELLDPAPDIRSHLETYSRLDIALDTFPYHGTTTTCEALWMQRPVVTLEGDRHASRVGVSLLTAAGRSAWIARTETDYVSIAVGLAHDRAALTMACQTLRDSLRSGPLFDYAGQAARFGAALRTCWNERHQEGMNPSPENSAQPAVA
ncbi:MAG: tetratricopeptide repeat protein [Opitutaceae bacterium]|nr:tetratricopeptide repeat protein [Opitutaceae bacterium]